MATRLPTASGFYKYAKLTKNSTTYAKKLNKLRDNIFTEVTRPTTFNGMRVVERFSQKPLDEDESIVNYYDYCRYPETDKLMQLLRDYGLFRDEHADFAEEMERLRELRGKGRKAFYERHHQKKD